MSHGPSEFAMGSALAGVARSALIHGTHAQPPANGREYPPSIGVRSDSRGSKFTAMGNLGGATAHDFVETDLVEQHVVAAGTQAERLLAARVEKFSPPVRPSARTAKVLPRSASLLNPAPPRR